MTLTEGITRINYALRGIDDDAPNATTDEYVYWLSLLNKKQDELYSDTTKNWNLAYSYASLGAVTSATTSVPVATNFMSASDKAVFVSTADSTEKKLAIVKANDRTNGVYLGGNPLALYIPTSTITEDGTLYLPGYYQPAYPVDPTDLIPLPDPNWGVTAVAAEIAFSDITYEDKAEALQARANFLYGLMAKNNRSGTFQNPRTTPYNITRIRNTEG